MTQDLSQPCAKWREQLDKLRARGEGLESFARELGLTDFSIRADWWDLTIDWCEHCDTLERFSERVKSVAERLGRPPDSCDASQWGAQYAEGQSPDLLAKWMFEHAIDGQKKATPFL